MRALVEFNWRGTGLGAQGYKRFVPVMSRVAARAPRPVPLHLNSTQRHWRGTGLGARKYEYFMPLILRVPTRASALLSKPLADHEAS